MEAIKRRKKNTYMHSCKQPHTRTYKHYYNDDDDNNNNEMLK